MPWELLKPLRVLRGADGVYIEPEGVVVLGIPAFEALGEPTRVRLLVDREAGLLGIKAAAGNDEEGFGLYSPDPATLRSAVNAVRAFRQLRINPVTIKGPHEVEMHEGMLVLRVAEWASK